MKTLNRILKKKINVPRFQMDFKKHDRRQRRRLKMKGEWFLVVDRIE